MDDKETTQVLRYRLAMSIAREMMNRGLISEEEYAIIDTIMANKHGVTSCTIFR